MSHQQALDLENFQFRTLHPNVFIGTASDRYAAWIGQIYSEDRYAHRISRRNKTVGGTSLVEEVLPVDSVEEYFQHFRVLELDFTFYRLLLEEDGRPTANYHTLKKYRRYLKKGDGLLLKVPQLISAQKLWRRGRFLKNEDYLDPNIFTRRFYEPVVEVLGDAVTGLIFEQEYQRKAEQTTPHQLAAELDRFFQKIPPDHRYHLELRTEPYLREPVFEVLEKHGVGQVLSHWTWLPALSKQWAKSTGRFFNSGGQGVLRLMTPLGMRYEEAYLRAHPFNQLVQGMQSQTMVQETAELIWVAVEEGIRINIIVNNRAGGNAPLLSREIAQKFLDLGETRRPD
jgi:uncharacterized protein YecE (DUF72 family)